MKIVIVLCSAKAKAELTLGDQRHTNKSQFSNLSLSSPGLPFLQQIRALLVDSTLG